MSRLQTNAIRHLGSVVDNIKVDSAGRVLMPNQPTVDAYRSAAFGSNAATPAVVPWDIVTLNLGNHYNASTGLFTCPVAGRYRMSANCINVTSLNDGVFTYNQITPVKNGTAFSGTSYAYNDGYASCSGTWIANCAAGDTLGFKVSSMYGSLNGMTIELIG